MIRTMLTPIKEDISIRLPQNYIGREVEVLVFAVDEGNQQQKINKNNIPFVVLHVEDKNFKFNRDEANAR